MAITWTLRWIGLGPDLSRTARFQPCSREQRIAFDKNEVIGRQICQGTELRCETGTVWVSFTGDTQDYVLRSGEKMTAPTTGRVVLQGLKPRNHVVVGK